MKVSSAFIRATQAQNVPIPDPWEPVSRRDWIGHIYSTGNVAFAFKYKRHIYQDGQWVPEDEWINQTFTNLPQTKIADEGEGSLIWDGNYQGMIPGLFYLDDSRYNPNNTHRTEYMLFNPPSGEQLTQGTLTYTAGGSSFYGSYFSPGKYRLEIVRYFGRRYSHHYNGNLADTIKVEGLIKTYESYGENDWFDFDPEVKEFEGYGDYPQFRQGHVVTLTENHVFEVENLWDSFNFSTIGIRTFCEGIRHVSYDLDGETEIHTPIGQADMIYLQDFNLYRLK